MPRRALTALQAIVHVLTRHGWVPLAAVLAAVAAVWGFVELADEVLEGDAGDFDRWLFENIAGSYDRLPGFWQEAGRDVTALGGVAIITLISVGVGLFLAMQSRWRALVLLAVTVAGGLLISLALKHAIDRPRPDLFDHRSHVMTASFPSGHSSNAATAYLSLAILVVSQVKGRLTKLYVLTLGLLTPFLVGVSRIFVGVHWPTDVLAGWLVGLAWGLLVYALATFLQKRHVIEEEGVV